MGLREITDDLVADLDGLSCGPPGLSNPDGRRITSWIVILLVVPLVVFACSQAVETDLNAAAAAIGTDAAWAGDADAAPRDVPGDSPVAHPPTILAEGGAEFADIVLDEHALYWRAAGAILTVPKQGGAPVSLASGYDDVAPRIALGDAFVYFSADGQQRRVPKSGGDSEALGGGGVLAVDHAWLYWAEPYGADATVYRRPKAGGAAGVVAEDQLFVFYAIADAEHLYWVHHDPAPLPVMRWPTSGGPAEVFAAEQHNPTWLAADATHVYWTVLPPFDLQHLLPGKVMRRAKSGGDVELVAQGMRPLALVVDETDAWYTEVADFESGRIMRVPKQGGEPIVVAEEPAAHLWGLAVDEQHVYWTTFSDGRVMRMAK